ncbi:hypothetical protein J3P71_04815 [Rhizobium leguminosarum]|uniref:hypothetical protein n=1 Tax=Rhizobium leguminosarum TaxID=384 RepID=UPI0014410371|nr:hypothetical protein [Rhizobium leguminosarum]MBY5836583.1 hypothetical protein [Rhizobium leguminosarum]NKM79375.1 hypothetical protein [Rhizobium leguminosarum bv. viciae]QSZ09104.1 hypothetical protein J3P71_04815 [Rhizobium leguminosarum]
MFWKRKAKSARQTLQDEIEEHREAIRLLEDFDDAFPDPAEHPEVHKQADSLEAMECTHITEAERKIFKRTASAGLLLNDRLEHGLWRVIEADVRLSDHWSGYHSFGMTGRHYKLLYGKLRTGTVVISRDATGGEDTEDVHLHLTFRFPFLYEFDAIYNLLRTLIWQLSDGTSADMDRFEAALTRTLLRTLWGIQRDEMYIFYFDESGPATVLFEALEKMQKRSSAAQI